MTRTEMNDTTRMTLAELCGMQDAAGDIMGGAGVMPEWFAGAFLVARRTGGADGGEVSYSPAISVGGSDTLLAGLLADLFAMRPAVYDRARRIYEWRMKNPKK